MSAKTALISDDNPQTV